MELNIASNQTAGYKVNIPVYEGPLDLLLKLIEHAELQITAISISQVTDQYLHYIREIGNSRPDQISAFLVIAAKLIQIKSEALLPRPVVREPNEEDPAEALAEQLRLYKKYKAVANQLELLESENRHTYLRISAPPKIEGKLDLSELTLGELFSVAQQIFLSEKEKQSLGTVISAPKITIRQKLNYISTYIREHDSFTFSDLIPKSGSRLEIVVTFLALLELVKRYKVNANQSVVFGDINIGKSEDWVNDEEFELEFE